MAETAQKQYTAKLRYYRVSPQKARLVLDLIKGRRVEDALNTLLFTKKRVAPAIHKLLRSALDNANYLANEKGEDVDVDNLYVARAVANEGPRMKRIRPAPMGRAYRYQRRISHIEVALAEKHRGNGVATVVGEEQAPAKQAKGRTAGKAKKPAAKKSAGKKTAKKKK